MGDSPSSSPPPDPSTPQPAADPQKASRRVTKDTTKRDRWISLVVASVIMFFLVFAVMEMSKGYRGVTGTIVEKKFVAAPETQITVGDGGLRKKDIPGNFYFIIHVPQDDQDYSLKVDQVVFESKEEGEEFYFVRPPRQRDAN